jgi:hypothetical protein
MLKQLILIAILFTFLSCQAQFSGIVSFWTDTNLRVAMKTHKVRTVTEYAKEDSSTQFNGRYYFNNDGLAINLVTGRSPYFTRMTFDYNKNGLVTKQTHYSTADTTVIENWKTTTYDAKNRPLKIERGQIWAGKTTVNKEYELIHVGAKPAAQRWEYRNYDGSNLLSLTLGRDSIAGRDTFSVQYTYGIDRYNGKKLLTGKTLSRSRKNEGCYYQDAAEYKVFGKTQVAVKLETSYSKITATGKWTEFGVVDYEEAYETFIQGNPNDFNPNYYSPKFTKAFLAGTIKGKAKPEIKYTFNEKGWLEETYQGGYRVRYNYNEKGQVTEQLTFNEQNEQVNSMQLFYDNKSLISKTVSTSVNQLNEDSARSANDEGTKALKQEFNYEYTYY